MDGQGEPERGAASFPAGFNGWNRRSHSAGHLCSKKCFSCALWSCRWRHAVRMARDSQYPPSFSPRHHERAAIEFAHASLGPPAFYDYWHSIACCDHDYNFFCGRTAMLGSGIFSFPRRHFSLLSACTQQTCLTLVPSSWFIRNRRNTDFVLRRLSLKGCFSHDRWPLCHPSMMTAVSWQ
jgi:hypothetical protein